jgi:group I intron endonuclease
MRSANNVSRGALAPLDSGAGIYAIVNSVTGARYIGQAINIQNRWNEHRRCLREDTHSNEHLQSAWNKYGEQAFRFEVLLRYELTGDTAYDRMSLILHEQHFIDQIWPASTLTRRPRGVYNLAPVASSSVGVKHSLETVAKYRENGRKGAAALTPERRQEWIRKRRTLTPPEQLSEWGRKGAAAWLAESTPEQRSAIGRKGAAAMHAALTPEQRSAIARKGAAAINHTRHHLNRNIVNPNCPLCCEVAA